MNSCSCSFGSNDIHVSMSAHKPSILRILSKLSSIYATLQHIHNAGLGNGRLGSGE
jgi:hypothetical protein